MRLPDSRNIQRVVPTAGGRIVTDDSTIQIGSAVRGVGAAMADESERRANFQISKARTAFLKAQADQDKQFEEDRDYEDMDTRYEEGLRKSLGEIGKGIKNERARTLFTEQMEGQVLNGVERTRGRARGIERDVERANVSENLNILNETALNAADPSAAIAEVGNLLEGAVEAGYYTAQEAASIDRGWRDRQAATRISMMEPQAALDALEAPWAENLPTELRFDLTTKAEATLAQMAEEREAERKRQTKEWQEDNYAHFQVGVHDGVVDRERIDLAYERGEIDSGQRSNLIRQRSDKDSSDASMDRVTELLTLGLPLDPYDADTRKGMNTIFEMRGGKALFREDFDGAVGLVSEFARAGVIPSDAKSVLSGIIIMNLNFK